MSDQDDNNSIDTGSATGNDSGKSARCGKRCGGPGSGRRKLLLLIPAVLVVGMIVGCVANSGYSRWQHGKTDAASVTARAERIVDRMMDRVEATPLQRSKAEALARQSAAELAPLIEAHMAARESLIDALTADTVNQARLEMLRAEAIQRADAASKRLVADIGDLARALSPAQRKELLSRWQRGGA